MQFKNLFINRYKHGYTLIEFLVVLGILVITVGVLTTFLTSVFRGTNKANASAEVKQNGQVVLDSLERSIRGASGVSSPNVNYNYIVVLGKPNGNLHIKCQPGVVDSYNSRIAIAVSSDFNELGDTDPNWRSLSNDDVKNGVNISSCILKLDDVSVSSTGQPVPAVVSISFTAKSVSNRVDSSARAQFQTKISLREY